MAKRETKSAKVKATEETKPNQETKPQDGEGTKDSLLEAKEAPQDIISKESTKDTSEEKEGIKSKENNEKENNSSPAEKEETPEQENTVQTSEAKNNGHNSGMTYEEAEKEMDLAECIKLPEWKGFWFKSLTEEKVYVLLSDGNIIDTPKEEYKERSDWEIAVPTEEQSKILEKFWDDLDLAKENKSQLDKYNSLKAVSYNKAKGTSFQKLKKEISIQDLHDRKNLPEDSARDSEFEMSNGYVFDLESSQLTNKKVK